MTNRNVKIWQTGMLRYDKQLILRYMTNRNVKIWQTVINRNVKIWQTGMLR